MNMNSHEENLLGPAIVVIIAIHDILLPDDLGDEVHPASVVDDVVLRLAIAS